MVKEKKTKKRVRLIVTLAIIVALIGGTVVYNTFFMDKTTHVTAATVTKGDIDQNVTLTGTVKTSKTETYFAPAQVKVEKLNVKKGDVVKAGDLLIEYDLDDLKKSYSEAALQYNNAKLAYEDALRENEENNAKALNAQKQIDWTRDEIKGLNALSTSDSSKLGELQGDLATYKSQKEAATNSVLSAEKLEQYKNTMNLNSIAVNSAKKYLDEGKSGIVAGITGVITQLNVEEGATASPAAACIVIDSLDNPVVSFSLGKYDVNSVKVGQTATIKIGGTEYTGKVSRIDSTTTQEGTSSVVKAEVSFDKVPESIVLGIEADLTILVSHKAGILTLPLEAERTDRDGSYCMVIENGIAKKVYIKIGSSSETQMEILSGLKEGDVIATSSPTTLEEGVMVTVDKQAATY